MAAEVEPSPYFIPAMRGVVAVTNAYPALVTTGTLSFPANVPTITTMDHGYKTGLKVYFWIPEGFGMPELHMYRFNLGQGFITEHPTNAFQFYIDIDTRLFRPFLIPPVVYNISPVTGFPVARRPYRTIDDGTPAGLLVVEQFPQVLPLGDKSWSPQEYDNVTHNPKGF